MIREQDAEEKKEKKEALSKQIHDKGNEFRECYMKMREADSTLVSLGRETDESRAGEKNIQGDNEVSADDTKTMTAAGYIELGADALDYAASGFEKFESVEKIGWNIAQADISILNKISMVTSSASFVTSFVSSIVTLCDWVNHSNRVSTSECLLKAADLFSSVVSFGNCQCCYRRCQYGSRNSTDRGRITPNRRSKEHTEEIKRTEKYDTRG